MERHRGYDRDAELVVIGGSGGGGGGGSGGGGGGGGGDDLDFREVKNRGFESRRGWMPCEMAELQELIGCLVKEVRVEGGGGGERGERRRPLPPIAFMSCAPFPFLPLPEYGSRV